jgi:hypothetical protein
MLLERGFSLPDSLLAKRLALMKIFGMASPIRNLELAIHNAAVVMQHGPWGQSSDIGAEWKRAWRKEAATLLWVRHTITGNNDGAKTAGLSLLMNKLSNPSTRGRSGSSGWQSGCCDYT